METLIPQTRHLFNRELYEILKQDKNIFQAIAKLDHANIFPYRTLSEGMEKETEKQIAEFINSIEVKPSRKLIVEFMSQDSIKQLLSNIVESAIIEFNKKFNPLFGAMQATGMDRQIKTFINMFLPGLLPKVADFLYTTSLESANSNLGYDLTLNFLRSPISELDFPKEEQIKIAESKFHRLRDTLLEDEKLNESLQLSYENVKGMFLKRYGTMTLREFLAEDKEEEYSSFKEKFSSALADIVIEYQEVNQIDRLLSELILDIISE